MIRPRRKLPNTTLSYQDIGKGHVIFCLPGFPTSSEIFTIIAKKLQSNARFISIDFPGWGGQSDYSNNYLNISTLAQLATDFIKSFNVENYSIMGYSLGTMVVQEMIRKNFVSPHKVILLSPITNFHWNGLPVLARGLFQLTRFCVTIDWYPNAFYQTRYHLLRQVARHLKDKSMGEEFHQSAKILQQEVEQTNIAISCNTLINVHQQEFTMPNIIKKTLVVYGNEDYHLVQSAAKDLAILPNVQIRKIFQAGHYCLWTHTDKMSKIIKKFMNEK